MLVNLCIVQYTCRIELQIQDEDCVWNSVRVINFCFHLYIYFSALQESAWRCFRRPSSNYLDLLSEMQRYSYPVQFLFFI